MAGADDSGSDVDTASNLFVCDAIHSRERDAGSIRKRLPRPVDILDVFGKSHGVSISRKREDCQSQTGQKVLFPRFGYHFSLGGDVKNLVSDAIMDAFFELVDRDGMATVRKRAGISSSTSDRWEKLRAQKKSPGINRSNLDALFNLEEVRSAAASALLKRPDQDQTAWEAISGELSDILSPATGWLLVRHLREMSELGILDSKLSVLAGAIGSRRLALDEGGAVRKLAKSKRKRKKV